MKPDQASPEEGSADSVSHQCCGGHGEQDHECCGGHAEPGHQCSGHGQSEQGECCGEGRGKEGHGTHGQHGCQCRNPESKRE